MIIEECILIRLSRQQVSTPNVSHVGHMYGSAFREAIWNLPFRIKNLGKNGRRADSEKSFEQLRALLFEKYCDCR